jgi:hypothetical protein
MTGKPSASLKEASATGRPASDPLVRLARTVKTHRPDV